MNIKRRSTNYQKTNKTASSTSSDGETLSSSGDEVGFQNYYAMKRTERDLDDCSENETKIRSLWNNMNNSRRKLLTKNIRPMKIERKRSISHASMLDGNFAEHSSIESCKKIKMETVASPNTKDSNLTDAFFQLEVQRLIASPANYSFQPVCNSCETFSDHLLIIRCTGVCLRYFHKHCLVYPPDNPLPEEVNFQCADCWNNIYSCNICKKSDKITSLLNCENSECGRLYHKVCLEKSHLICKTITRDSIKSCPAHHCVTCARESPKSIGKPIKNMFQCIRCPVAFHDDDLCMAAGAMELSLSQVICPNHFQDHLVKLSAFKPIHPDWCFKCFKSGAKIKCQYCPNTFHFECVIDYNNDQELKENNFVCLDCCNHRQPRYGEIMFVKVGQYRWWPCEVIHPRNAPMNILRLNRPEGTFPIMFLGSNEYQWVAKSRMIPYNIASLSPLVKDSCGTMKMDREFNAGLEQAVKMHKVYVNILRKYVPLTSIIAEPMSKSEIQLYLNFKESDSKKTVRYSLIKSNVVVPPAKLPLKKLQVICGCSDGCELFKCKNFLNKVECDKNVCPFNDKCHNHLFTNHVNKNLGVNKTSNRGFGLKTTELLKENEFIIEYVGEIISKSMSAERMKLAMNNNVKDFYMMKLCGDLVVDAGPKGNLSRFINHSCNPNCRVERWTVNGYAKLGIFANQDISPDEELTFDYKRSGFLLKEDVFCLCNSINCSGFLGPEKMTNVSPSKLSALVKGLTLTKSEEAATSLINNNSPETGKSINVFEEEEGPLLKKSLQSPYLNISPINIEKNKFLGDVDDEEEVWCTKEERSAAAELNKSQDINEAPLKSSIKRCTFLSQSLPGQGLRNYVFRNDSVKGLRKKGRPPKNSINFDEFIKKCAPTNNEVSDGPLSAETNSLAFVGRSKSLSNKTLTKKIKIFKEKVEREDSSKIEEEAAEKVRIIKELTRELEGKGKSEQKDLGYKSESKKVIKEHESKNKSKQKDFEYKTETNKSHQKNQEESKVSKENEVTKVNEASVQYSSNIALINECLKSKDPSKEFARRTLLLNESNHSFSSVRDDAAPYDDITERLRATDAAIESLTKTIVIKDSSMRLHLKKDSEYVTRTDFKVEDAEEDSNKDSEYESYCFRCFDGGQLILCDKKGCTKAYHLSCLGLKRAPVGTWYCPWHFCNSCGAPSDLFCVQCPGSYCQSHYQDGGMQISSSTRLSRCCYHTSSKEISFKIIAERQSQIQTTV